MNKVKNFRRYAMRYLQAAYAVLAMLIQMDWQYISRAILGVGAFMGDAK